jgi:ketosteroid isomerase-like protein
MKNFAIYFLAIVLTLTLGCQQEVNVEAEKENVKSILASYVTSVEEEDMELYSKNILQDTAMVNFGGFGDPIIGWDALKEVMEGQNSALSETKITVSNLEIKVSESGKFAFATCLWNLKAIMKGEPIELPVRCTFILEKQKSGWIIVHFHKSISAG